MPREGNHREGKGKLGMVGESERGNLLMFSVYGINIAEASKHAL
jgi:hypothetical protein